LVKRRLRRDKRPHARAGLFRVPGQSLTCHLQDHASPQAQLRHSAGRFQNKLAQVVFSFANVMD
jgi:hypothetical protein